jgi:hypothetical protein
MNISYRGAKRTLTLLVIAVALFFGVSVLTHPSVECEILTNQGSVGSEWSPDSKFKVPRKKSVMIVL